MVIERVSLIGAKMRHIYATWRGIFMVPVTECPACVGCKTIEASALSVENQSLREENIRLRTERTTRLAYSERVIDWIRNGTKPAVTSFTEGAERQIAYVVEDDRLRRNRANQQTLKGNSP